MTVVGTPDGRYTCCCVACGQTFQHDNKRSIECGGCRSLGVVAVKAPERIVAAAISTDAGTFRLPRPARHDDVIRHVRALGYRGSVAGDRQGFCTDTNRFVGRREAWGIAVAAGQIKCPLDGCAGTLYSENLW